MDLHKIRLYVRKNQFERLYLQSENEYKDEIDKLNIFGVELENFMRKIPDINLVLYDKSKLLDENMVEILIRTTFPNPLLSILDVNRKYEFLRVELNMNF